ASIAGPVSEASLRTSRRKRKLDPCRLWTASMTLRRAEKSIASDEIWKVRPSPRRARADTPRPVMSLPRKRIVPALGFSVPLIWWISVVLPAPFGPISAWISPGLRSRLTLSVAFRPPKLFERFRMSMTGSAMTHLARDQTDDAAAREKHDAEQDEAEEKLPALGDAAEHEFEQHREDRAGHGPEQPPRSTEDDQHDQLSRHVPRHHGGGHEAVEVCEKRTRDARDDRR